MRTWWHVHEGPPYRCWGGADYRRDAEDLAEVEREVYSRSVVVVESQDGFRECSYRPRSGAMITGLVARHDDTVVAA